MAREYTREEVLAYIKRIHAETALRKPWKVEFTTEKGYTHRECFCGEWEADNSIATTRTFDKVFGTTTTIRKWKDEDSVEEAIQIYRARLEALDEDKEMSRTKGYTASYHHLERHRGID